VASLSLCITTYNRAGPLRECLDSIVRAGDGHDIELVVSDNASTDDTPRVLEEFARRVPWMRWYRLPQNIGGDRNFYRVTEAAAREYVWVVGDDDRLAPTAIASVLAALAHEPTVTILNFETWDREFTRPVSGAHFSADGPLQLNSANDLMDRFGLGPSFISAVVFRRAPFLDVPFSEYEELVAGGMAFFFAVYRAMWLAPKAMYVPHVLVLQRGDNIPALSEMGTWYRFFVEGVDEALSKLAAVGYAPRSVARAKRGVLLDLVMPDIWNRVQSGQPVRTLFPLLRRHYRRSAAFWLLCVPALFAPTWLLRPSRKVFRLVRGKRP
jgi:abequosyltransferase